MKGNSKIRGINLIRDIKKYLPHYIFFLSGLVLALLLVVKISEIGILKKTLLKTTREITSLELQYNECRRNVSVNTAIENLNDSNYDPSLGNPPLYPGYTIGWRLYINEKNNYLFLYPEKFEVINSFDILFDEVELSNLKGGKIVVQRLDDITNNSKSLEFEAFLDSVSKGENVSSEDGYIAAKNSNLDSYEGVTYLKEYKDESSTTFYSAIIRHLNWPEVTRVRTEGLSIDDLRAITESFKYLRNN